MQQKKQIPVLCCLSLFPLQQLAAETENTSRQPNIILIYCDDLRYGDLGVTGHTAQWRNYPVTTAKL